MRYVTGVTILFLLLLGIGCQHERVDDRKATEVLIPDPTPPMKDVPPQPAVTNPHIETGVKPQPQPAPAATREEKNALLFTSRVDLLRVMICSQEKVLVDNEVIDSDEYLQRVKEHFSDIGFRVVETIDCMAYETPGSVLSRIANERDIDMYVLLAAKVRQVDKFGDFYSFEAEGRGKVAQISDNELVTTQSTAVRGKRALSQDQAAKSALQQCGRELGVKLSDEILRKSGRGLLLRRIEVEGLTRMELVDYVRVDLSKKPGIQSVALRSWDQKSGRAIFWVRLDASVKENIGAYLEQLDQIKLRVERMDQSGSDSHRKAILER